MKQGVFDHDDLVLLESIVKKFIRATEGNWDELLHYGMSFRNLDTVKPRLWFLLDNIIKLKSAQERARISKKHDTENQYHFQSEDDIKQEY